MPARAWRHRVVRGAAAMAALAIALAVPAVGGAQGGVPAGVVVKPGDLVRVRTAQWEYTGRLARIGSDTAVVQFDTDSAVVPRASVLRLQVQQGTRVSTERVVLGTVAGAGLGMVAGAAIGALIECSGSCGDAGDGTGGIIGFLSGGLTGGVIGAFGGGMWAARKRYPRWVQAVLP